VPFAWKQGRPEDANSLFADALQISTETQRSDGIANAAVNLAVVAAPRRLGSRRKIPDERLEAYTEMASHLDKPPWRRTSERWFEFGAK